MVNDVYMHLAHNGIDIHTSIDYIHCTVFGLHKDDVARFCMFRLMTNDMKWIDDFVENEKLGVPMHIIKKYADNDVYNELVCSECNEL